MQTEGERLATLEEQYRDLVRRLDDRKAEEKRTRDRLHKLEGITGTLVDEMKHARRQEAVQYRRLELRLQAMTVAVAIVGIALTIATLLTHH